jgi:hypothetical protein
MASISSLRHLRRCSLAVDAGCLGQKTAVPFDTTRDKVRDAVLEVVNWGLQHRTLANIRSVGVNKIQYAKGNTYLVLVYQIDSETTRLLWVGKELTIETFHRFFIFFAQKIA